MVDQISLHEIRIYECVRTNGGWMTAREIGVSADVANRTARHHAAEMTKLGILDCFEAHGGYRYRLKTEVGSEGREYLDRLEMAKQVMSG